MKLRFYLPIVFSLFLMVSSDLGAQEGCDEPPCWPPLECNQISGSSAGFTPGTPGVSFPCGTVENNQWFSMIADSNVISVEIDIYNCEIGTGLQMILYDQNLNPVSNCFSEEGAMLGSIIAPDLIPGAIYWLMIDGWAADICDFDLLITGNQVVNIDSIANPGPISASNNFTQICKGTKICFTSNPVVTDQTYYWNFGLPVEVLSGRVSNSTCVKFKETGLDTVTVFFDEGCKKSIEQHYFIEVVDSPVRDLGVIEVCANEYPFELNGETYSSPGSYTQNRSNTPGCDSLISFDLQTIPNEFIVSYDTLCGRDTFFFRDTFYIGPGLYVYKTNYPSGEACDSFFRINLRYLPNVQVRETASICQNEVYLFNGDSLQISGTYTAVYQTRHGCDSTVVLDLHVNPAYTILIDTSVLENTFLFNTLISNDTVLVFTFQTEFGCDSTVVYDVSVGTSAIPLSLTTTSSTLFPNPVKEELTLFNKEGLKLGSVEIFDPKGQLIKIITDLTMLPNNNYTFKVGELIRGTYFIRMIGKDGKKLGTKKFVKF